MNKPWEELPKVWKTESAFWSWMKGLIRRGWNRHPSKIAFINAHRKLVPNTNPRGKKKEVWGGECARCHNVFMQKDLEVNHIGETASLTSYEDIAVCVEKLLIVSMDDLEWLCKPCHKVYSYSQAHDISEEEAKIELDVVDFRKKKATEQREILLTLGVDVSTLTTAAKRINAYRQIMKEKINDCAC